MIHRLELKAALLVSRLLQSTAQELNIPEERCYAWSDSLVAYAGSDSPTRGIDPDQLAHHRLWFNGPACLSGTLFGRTMASENSRVLHPTSITTATRCAQHEGADLFAAFSDVSALLRFLIRMRRWVRKRLRRSPNPPVTALCIANELTEAMKACVRLSQSVTFQRNWPFSTGVAN